MSERLKECNRCNISKPLTDFSIHGNTKDGRQYSCKECIQARYSERYVKKRDERKTGVMQPWFIFD